MKETGTFASNEDCRELVSVGNFGGIYDGIRKGQNFAVWLDQTWWIYYYILLIIIISFLDGTHFIYLLVRFTNSENGGY